jgi:OOP family OmpA-OmpF porin
MRDPLAVNPALIIASRGVDTNEVVARWQPYVSTDPTLVLARARRVLAPPGGVTLSLRADTLTATGRAPAFWIVRAEGLAPALAGVAAADLTHVAPGLPANMEAIAAEIERMRTLFMPGSDVLDQTALTAAAAVAVKFQALVAAAVGNRYDVTLRIVGRADPSGAESDNLALSRRRAAAVRDRLTSLDVPLGRLAVDGIGSNDPVAADSPGERARLNRSVSFVVQARPSASETGAERQR